jgi:ATP-dependent RNA helicase RhlB
MDFIDFNLDPDLQKGIEKAGFKKCMPVQEAVLQKVFGAENGLAPATAPDLYVQSQTGTGKTAAFLTVIFQRLQTEPEVRHKKALIMTPTRELAVQIEEDAKLLGAFLPYKTASFYGGVGYNEQLYALRNGAQILIGTPGRVLDLNASGQMNLSDVAFLILDEADRMFDMGFYPDLRKLIKVVPPASRRETMLFSATLNNYVKNLAWEYTNKPVEVAIEPEHVTVDEITQLLYHVPTEDKTKLLLGILQKEKPESAIIFCNTKSFTETIARRLRANGIRCEFISGDLPQPKRLKIIEDLKAGKIKYLVATDVAARGLDIDSLAMVINYDLPNEAENYVHRIGRTARAGKAGKAVSFAGEQDVYELPAIERYIGGKIPSEIAHREDYGVETAWENKPRTTRTARMEPQKKAHAKPQRRQEKNEPRTTQTTRTSPVRAGSARPAKPSIDLAHMTQEERMAYYKNKYQPQKVERSQKPQAKKHQPQKPRPKQEVKPEVKKQELSASAPLRENLFTKLKNLFTKRKTQK